MRSRPGVALPQFSRLLSSVHSYMVSARLGSWPVVSPITMRGSSPSDLMSTAAAHASAPAATLAIADVHAYVVTHPLALAINVKTYVVVCLDHGFQGVA